MSQENVEIVRRCLDGWNRGDFDAWMDSSHSHPEIEWSSEVTMRMEGSEAVFRGRDGLRKYWDEWHALWEVRIDPTEIRDLGDTVLVIAQTRTRVEASGIDIRGPWPTSSSSKAPWHAECARISTRAQPSKLWGCRSSRPVTRASA